MAIPSIALIPSGYKTSKLYSVLPTDGTGDFTFTRAGQKTRVDKNNNIETLSVNLPPLDYTGGGCPVLLIEPVQTQIYGETDTMATQTKTVAAVEHTVGFYGTGTVTFTGVYSGTLVGTGANNRVELTFTPTAGDLISTVSGTVLKSQLVTGAYLGSYIINSGTNTVSRVSDKIPSGADSSLINSEEGVLFAEIAALSDDGTNRFLSINDTTSTNRIVLSFLSSNEINCRLKNSTDQCNLSSSVDIKNYNKIAFKWKVNDFALWVNGVEVETDTSGITFNADTLNNVSFDSGTGSANMFCKLKKLYVYKSALTDSELETLTI